VQAKGVLAVGQGHQKAGLQQGVEQDGHGAQLDQPEDGVRGGGVEVVQVVAGDVGAE
jgi:hypothetical protein